MTTNMFEQAVELGVFPDWMLPEKIIEATEEDLMTSKKDPNFEPGEVEEAKDQAVQELQMVLDEAVAQLIGDTPLPALLFVNTDKSVVRVDTHRIMEPRDLEILRAMMNLCWRVNFHGRSQASGATFPGIPKNQL